VNKIGCMYKGRIGMEVGTQTSPALSTAFRGFSFGSGAGWCGVVEGVETQKGKKKTFFTHGPRPRTTPGLH
jgi:hypothetical protein